MKRLASTCVPSRPTYGEQITSSRVACDERSPSASCQSAMTLISASVRSTPRSIDRSLHGKELLRHAHSRFKVVDAPNRNPRHPCAANVENETAGILQNPLDFLTKRHEPLKVSVQRFIAVLFLAGQRKGGEVITRLTLLLGSRCNNSIASSGTLPQVKCCKRGLGPIGEALSPNPSQNGGRFVSASWPCPNRHLGDGLQPGIVHQRTLHTILAFLRIGNRRGHFLRNSCHFGK